MYQLTYRSTAQPNLEIGDIRSILKESKINNLKEDITGCLVHYGNSFVQILEGRKRDVLKSYARIKIDERHYNVELIWSGTAAVRYFNGWSMAFYHHRALATDDTGKRAFVNNMVLLSEISEKTSSSMLSFWATVNKMLKENPLSNDKLI